MKSKYLVVGIAAMFLLALSTVVPANAGGTCRPICELTGDYTEEDDSVPSVRLVTNRWILDWDDIEEEYIWMTKSPRGRGPRRSYDIEDTYGCNCEQILEWLHENYPEDYGKMRGHWKHGCSISVMDTFIELTE
jgi:hypothetical protein